MCGQVQGEEGPTVFVRNIFGGEARRVEESDMLGVVLGSQHSKASAWASWSGWPTIDCGSGKQGRTCPEKRVRFGSCMWQLGKQKGS